MPPAEESEPSEVSAGDPAAVVRRFLDEVVNSGNLRAIDRLVAEDLAWHGGSLGDVHGLAALKAHMAANASTGMHMTVKDIMTAGEQSRRPAHRARRWQAPARSRWRSCSSGRSRRRSSACCQKQM